MQASERAAARIEATRNSGQSTPMRPDDMMAFVKPATEAQAPDEMSYVPLLMMMVELITRWEAARAAWTALP